MDTSLTHRPDQPLTDDALVLERVEFLIQQAIRRQFWMLFLNADQTLADAIMPCDDLPEDPHVLADTDIGPLPHAEALARTLSHLMPDFGFAEAIFVWERPGGPAVGPDERAWAHALALACADRGVRIRGQFLTHDSGVRPLTPDDFAP